MKWNGSIFVKMIAFFVVFGLTPIILLSFLFFDRYYQDVESSTSQNYMQILNYLEKNISSIILEIDDATAYMYDFSTPEFSRLSDVLQSDTLDKTKKQAIIGDMLTVMMMGNPYISSLRFYSGGEVYTLFSEQGKAILDETKILNEVTFTKETIHEMLLKPYVCEEGYYSNASGKVFTIVRAYIDTQTVKSTNETYLGILYVDVDVDAIARVMGAVDIGEHGGIYIYNPKEQVWLYDSESKDENKTYIKDAFTLEDIDLKSNRYWYFYKPLTNTDYYVVMEIYREDVLDTYAQNRVFILTILACATLVLSVASIYFSDKINRPAKQLKAAMQRVEKGELQVHVDIKTNDEMEYLGEGFNKMVQELKYYIEQSYVLRLREREAELKALKMQIKPHYLYNTLDIIRMTALENDDPVSARLLESLAIQLRYIMNGSIDRVTIVEELELIKEYVILMNARYKNQITLSIDLAPDCEKVLILKLLLQPIVENAIKHGLAGCEGNIDIVVKRKSQILEIVILDDGKGMREDDIARLMAGCENARGKMDGEKDVGKGHGIALKNIYARIKLGCGEQYGFMISSVEGLGTSVRFTLPIWE